MATGKRYYWIKLKDTFMTSDAVDFLMEQKDGANYIVLYQMLCLKTINTGGRLERTIGEVIIPYDEEKIQRDTKWFTIDTVRVALNLYKALGLIYADDNGVLCLTDHDNLVGSTTDYADQKKLQRENKQNLLPESGVDNVHSDVHQNVHTDIRDKDIRYKEIKRSDTRDTEDKILSNESICRTKDVRRIVDAWNSLGLQQVVKVSPDSARGKMLRARVNEYGVDEVLRAIEKVRQSDFLKGSNDFLITFDWFVKPNNFPKVLEGNYDNRNSKSKSSSSVTSNPFLKGMMRGVDDEEE